MTEWFLPPYTYFSVSCFRHSVIKSHIAMDSTSRVCVILTRYLQSIEYIHSLLSISQMRLVFCHVLVQNFPKHVECGSVKMAPHAVQI